MAKKKMSFKLNKSPQMADVHVAISYNILYSDYDTVDPYSFIENIPTLPMLNFVVGLQNQVIFSISNTSVQRKMIQDMCPWLEIKERKKAWEFQKDQSFPLLITCDTTFLFFRLALSRFVQMEQGDDELDLCDDEMLGVYKALLYCNQKWTDAASPNINDMQLGMKTDPMYLTKLSVKIDLPIVEFKQHKDFRTQFVKAVHFIKFCENDETFRTYLPYFYADYQCHDWKEYLLNLFQFYSNALNGSYVQMDANVSTFIHNFFDQYTIDITDSKIQTIWSDNNGLNYLRSHFLLKLANKNSYYLVLNTNLLVDKMFQGLKFDFFNTIKKHKLRTKEGKKYTDYPHFNSVLGAFFSEPQMLYPFMHKTFEGIADKLLEGAFLKKQGITGEPDFYMRQGDTLFLIEYKDLTLGDTIKYSNDINFICQEIKERLCYDGNDSKGHYKRKGGGQLLATMKEHFDNNIFNKFDSDITNVKKICPIILTNDSAFSAMGISGIVLSSYEEIKKRNKYKFGDVFVTNPLVIDLDSLIRLSYLIHIGKLNLWDVLWDYLKDNHYNIKPFNSFVHDNLLRYHTITAEENAFLFDDFIHSIN